MKTETVERPVVNDDDTDDLLHVFCTWCERADKRRAKKPVPFCGKQKVGPWQDATGSTDQVCQMCVLILQESPCTRCGNRSRV